MIKPIAQARKNTLNQETQHKNRKTQTYQTEIKMVKSTEPGDYTEKKRSNVVLRLLAKLIRKVKYWKLK